MKYSFHPSAEKELTDAVDYYNAAQRGLGLEFAKEIHRTIQTIISFPNSWTQLSAHTRRCLTNRFPYAVIYQVTADEIFIIAVMQLSREPEYWKERTKKG